MLELEPFFQSANRFCFQSGYDDGIRDETVLGWNGAAFAAFGDIVADTFFVGVVDPFVDSREGVKLGESTLNRFLLPLLKTARQPLAIL